MVLYLNLQVGDSTLVKVPLVTFSRLNPNSGKRVASRTQIPLKLAYAVTCHRAQGLTLPACIVDCKEMHQAGK